MEDKLLKLGKALSNYKYLNIDVLRSICSMIESRCHLAIMNQPYLNYILSGKKSIESRFTKVRCSPFREVNNGDILILKESSGDIVAISSIKKVEYYGNLSKNETFEILIKYQSQLAIDKDFIEMKKESKYVSLFYIDKTITIPPIKLKKSDRRAWVNLKTTPLLF